MRYCWKCRYCTVSKPHFLAMWSSFSLNTAVNQPILCKINARYGATGQLRKDLVYLFQPQPLSVHGWTSAFLLVFHRLCGAIKGDWAIFCHAGSGRVGRVGSAREKSLEIFRMAMAWGGQTVRYIHCPTGLSWLILFLLVGKFELSCGFFAAGGQTKEFLQFKCAWLYLLVDV